MVLSDIDYPKEFGEIQFGEINNYAYTQYSDSFNNYFSSEDLIDTKDILKNFGSFKFGEINNLLLSDYEKSLIQYFFGE